MNLGLKKFLYANLLFNAHLGNPDIEPIQKVFNNVQIEYVLPNTLGFDVSDVREQADLTKPVAKGGEFVVVRTSRYANDNKRYGSDHAREQIASAKQHNLPILAYHASFFSDSVSKAKEEARYAVSKAREYGIKKGTYLACDYELNATSNRNNNTKAIIAFMDEVKKNGYRPLLYTGLKYVKEYVNISDLVDRYGNCIWLANYPKLGVVEKPNKAALDGLKVPGVLLYQYTDKWYNLVPNGDSDGDVSNRAIIMILDK